MKKYVFANWKANKTLAEVNYWLDNFPNSEEDQQKLAKFEIVLAPPYPLLALAKTIIERRHLSIKLAVQDLSPFGKGSYTGEVAAANLADLNIEYAILGHSERRRFLAESPQLIADKVQQALAYQIQPVLCLDQAYFQEQASFLQQATLQKLLLAYEPLAAIGSGQAESPQQLAAIKQTLQKTYGLVPIIYGGSVNDANVADFLKLCDGVLVGGASLKLIDFIDLLFAASQFDY
jgi:triosephosphate isomerase (TIM)